MPPQLLALLTRQGGVFSTRQAIGAGMRYDELRRFRDRGEIVQLRQGIFTPAEQLGGDDARQHHAIEVAGALLARELRAATRSVLAPNLKVAAAHRTAALLWRLPAPKPRPSPASAGRSDLVAKLGPGSAFVPSVIELASADRCRRSYRHGVHVRPAVLPEDHLASEMGLPVTNLARTAVDLMREMPWPDAVAVADAALRRGVTRADLAAIVELCTAWRGGAQAVRAAAFANGHAESPAESRARLVFAELGLPVPEQQVDIDDSTGHIGRVDFLFREFRTVVEIDGRIKYTDPYGRPEEVLWREKQREDRLRDAGYEVVRVTWDQLVNDRAGVERRIRAAFARGARLPV